MYYFIIKKEKYLKRLDISLYWKLSIFIFNFSQNDFLWIWACDILHDCNSIRNSFLTTVENITSVGAIQKAEDYDALFSPLGCILF